MKVGGKCDARHLKVRVAHLLDIRQRSYVMSYVHVFDTACDYIITTSILSYILCIYGDNELQFSLFINVGKYFQNVSQQFSLFIKERSGTQRQASLYHSIIILYNT